ncbi:1-aminocyclopropane-1-carboxylate deaminase [Flavobacteriaceae bacterium MAR_2009_75]|nr:1-aminocyclopropane-1-carboxylate deaminase [Flavobacteriaceae bacterium MAR_2009_75]
MKAITEKIPLSIAEEKKVSLFLRREDLLHPQISGNKFRKLKYNLEAAKAKGHVTLLTFGGAFSNHIAATAYAGKFHNLKTIGVIRGEELSENWHENQTLVLAHEQGMQFKFVTREAYRKKNDVSFIDGLKSELGEFYLLPEGGTNSLAVKGCEEILNVEDKNFDYIACAVGTGGTIAGISNAAVDTQKVLGFPALKGDFLKEDICKFATKENWNLCSGYHFGGYAKVTTQLVDFINEFKKATTIPLDPIYTGKMMFGILDLIKRDYFPPGSKILAIHTGGLQGVKGMNENLKKKNLPLICV